jgi:hypothetical protein
VNIALGPLFCILALGGGESDLVVLKSGKELRGRIVFEDVAKVVLRQDARDTSLEREEIERVESRVSNLGALLDNDAKWQPLDMGELELLAAQAKETNLPGEAEVYSWRRLLLRRDLEHAHLALGHKKRGKSWAMPLDGRWVDWDKRVELAKDWGSAWELRSLHYELRSNLPLQASLDALLDLERLYRAFFGIFGAELVLYDVCKPMHVHLHADAASYPEVSTELGFYEPETDTLRVKADKGLEFWVVAHELTHQLLHDTAIREQSDGNSIPAWLNEGLADYMAACVQSTSPLVFVAGAVDATRFQAHARAKDPFDLTRVLSFSTGDYAATSDLNLKYAQSYTLVHFLLHGREGRYRAGFLEFLRAVYRNKGSSTDLKNALGVEWRPLEKEWHAYARGMKL